MIANAAVAQNRGAIGPLRPLRPKTIRDAARSADLTRVPARDAGWVGRQIRSVNFMLDSLGFAAAGGKVPI